MVILEAWAAGVPTLMTRACNLDEGFATGAAIETSADVDGLVEKLAEIDQWSTARLAQASEAARLLASEHFGEAAITARFSSLYAAVSQEAL
jgi:poly(glycerol-phosphate) alpha-glucosyltransferase